MYKTKHNEANGENNRDGTNDNHSVNFGHEGPSGDQIIVQQRQRATMNLLGTLLLSLGTPMLLAGDEFGNSQNGNNNAYTQDNDTTWLDWDWLYSTEQTPELKQFNLTSRLITLRKSRDLYNHEDFFTRLSEIGLLKKSDRVHWYLPNGQMPNDADWTNPSVRSFAMQLLSPDEPSLLILINGSDEVTRFICRKTSNGRWSGPHRRLSANIRDWERPSNGCRNSTKNRKASPRAGSATICTAST